MNESSPAYPNVAPSVSTGSSESEDQPLPPPGCGDGIDLAPLGTEEEFIAALADLVASQRPRLFSLCEEYGDRADGWVVAWGLALEDRAEVVSVDCGLRATCESAESAMRLLSRRRRLRLLWCDPQLPESGEPSESGQSLESGEPPGQQTVG